MNRFLSFCNVRSPFPVSESVLCYIVAFLARQGLSPATIKTDLVTIRHAQIIKGHAEPRDSSSLPRLRLLQNEVRREQSRLGHPTHKRLPITPLILRRLRGNWLSTPTPSTHDHDVVMPGPLRFFVSLVSSERGRLQFRRCQRSTRLCTRLGATCRWMAVIPHQRCKSSYSAPKPTSLGAGLQSSLVLPATTCAQCLLSWSTRPGGGRPRGHFSVLKTVRR